MLSLDNTIRFGIHGGQTVSGFDQYLEVWQRAEELGIHWGSIYDHFRPPDNPEGDCMEGTTMLAALAAKTERIRCGMLVLGVMNRHPAMVASIASTIDNVSKGRLELGLGAGAPDLSQVQYGFPMPDIKSRMEMLDEYCTIINGLLYEEITDFAGKHYQLSKARMRPKPIQERIPLVIGGSGEKTMLRLVAKHADIWNTFVSGNITEYKHKLKLLDDYRTTDKQIRKSILFRAVIFEDETEIKERLASLYNTQDAEGLLKKGYLCICTPEQCKDVLLPYVKAGVRDLLLGIKFPVDWTSVELFHTKVLPMLISCI